MPYTTFTFAEERIFTEQVFGPEFHNVRFLCELCGSTFAEANFGEGRKWRFVTDHCAQCDPKWGGSFFCIHDRNLHATLPRAILARELEQELARNGLK